MPWRAPFPCIDVHVHLHPPRLADAIQRHFAREGWVARHPFEPSKVAETLAERGVERFCFFSYAHKPGMARELNRWVAGTAAGLPGAVGIGTLHPDDPDVDAIAAEATGTLGLQGFKFHHSVQRFHVDDERLFGADSPLIRYDYDEERRWAWDRALPDAVRRKIFHDNAARLLARG